MWGSSGVQHITLKDEMIIRTETSKNNSVYKALNKHHHVEVCGTELKLILKPKQKDLWSILMAAVNSTVKSIEIKCTHYYHQPTADSQNRNQCTVINNLMGK